MYQWQSPITGKTANIYPDARIVASETPFSLKSWQPVQQRIDSKPRGLWYAMGPEWLQFTKWNMPKWFDQINYLYRLDIDDDLIFKVRNAKEVNALERDFGTGLHVLDWPRFAEGGDYCGIEFPNYKRSLRDVPFWYYGIDVSSGCIWDPRAILGVTELATI